MDETQRENGIRRMLALMTLREKVAQMMQAEIAHVTPAELGRYCLGSVLNGGGSYPGRNKHASAADWLAMADAFYSVSTDTANCRLGIPVIWGTDAVHGHNNVMGATLFPHNIGLGAANDPDLIRRIGEATAREVSVTGIEWVFAPTVAIVKDPRWGRTYEGYASTPDIVSRYAGQMVLGLQGAPGKDFSGPGRVIATAKHFIGDGGTHKGIDQGDVRLGRDELIAQHGAGYLSAIDADVQTVMASFNSWNGEKVHGSRELLTGLLKQQWGFRGFVVSDWNGFGQIPGCNSESCPQAINAGIDMLMVPEDWKALLENTVAQVESGEISIARIDDAVARILRVKVRAGLFDGLAPSARPFAGQQQWLGHAEHRAVAREAVRKSLVLLKNNDALLPLRPAGRKVLVAGTAANSISRQSGGWTLSWQGTGNTNSDFPGATSIHDGLRAALESGGATVEYSPTGEFRTHPDAAIVVIGETPYAEGQGDIETLDYQGALGRDLAMLKRLRAAGIPVVTVFLSGRPLWVNRELNASNAFVAAWLPGSEGAGVADVLIADAAGVPRYDFSGRLPLDWPGRDLNSQDPASPDVERLFARGFGLTYGENEARLSENLPEEAVARSGSLNLSVFKAGKIPLPWSLMLGDSSDWRRPVGGALTVSPFGELSVRAVDRKLQEDSRQLRWAGHRPGQVYWFSEEAVDLRALSAQRGALAMTIRVDDPPEGAVGLRMDCGYPCSGAVELGEVLAKATPGQWIDLAIELSCFEHAGTDLGKVDAAAVFESSAPITMTINKLQLTNEYGKESLLACDTISVDKQKQQY